MVGTLLSDLEKEKSGNDRLKTMSKKEAKEYVERFALGVFVRCDNEDRAGKAHKGTVSAFLAAAAFLELLKQFGELDEGMAQKIKYAKFKAAQINKALRNGEVPPAGPPGGDGEEPSAADLDELDAALDSAKPMAPGPPRSASRGKSTPDAPPAPMSRADSYSPSTSGIASKDMEKAQKHCKHAISALAFDDVPAAIKELKGALKLLEG